MKHRPFAFTEHGAIMAANLLNSPQVVQMSVFVVRAFIKMRSLLTDTRALANKLATLEKELTDRLDTHEAAITDFMSRLLQLLEPPPAPPPPPDKELGFHTTLKPRARPCARASPKPRPRHAPSSLRAAGLRSGFPDEFRPLSRCA